MKKHNLQGQAIEIAAQAVATDLPTTFTEKNCMKLVGEESVLHCLINT